jgi:type IV secretory pathway protease TraF
MDDLKLPDKGFTKAERAWLKELIQAIKTVRAVSGTNVSISNSDAGQIINANDC